MFWVASLAAGCTTWAAHQFSVSAIERHYLQSSSLPKPATPIFSFQQLFPFRREGEEDLDPLRIQQATQEAWQKVAQRHPGQQEVPCILELDENCHHSIFFLVHHPPQQTLSPLMGTRIWAQEATLDKSCSIMDFKIVAPQAFEWKLQGWLARTAFLNNNKKWVQNCAKTFVSQGPESDFYDSVQEMKEDQKKEKKDGGVPWDPPTQDGKGIERWSVWSHRLTHPLYLAGSLSLIDHPKFLWQFIDPNLDNLRKDQEARLETSQKDREFSASINYYGWALTCSCLAPLSVWLFF